MADQPKKPRTAAQADLSAKQKEAAAALKAAGIPAFAPNQSYYVQQEKLGKAKETILENIKQRQIARKAALAAKKATGAPAAVAAVAVANGNGTRNNKPKVNAGTAKLRSAKQLEADKKMKNLKAAFNSHNIKYGAPSMKHFKEQKALGRSNSEVYEEMKGMFPRFTVNNTGAKKAVVVKRAVTAKKANAAPRAANVVAVANNQGAVKGQYVCEKCRFVANNTRRNNRPNNKPVNVPRGNINAYMEGRENFF
jgi:hypothetical protein